MADGLLNPIRRWVLKSIPVDLLLAEWLKIRDLEWLGEDKFPQPLKEQAMAEAFFLREGGEIFGDRRKLNIGLVCRSDRRRVISRGERLQILEEIRDYLLACGRSDDEYEFLKPSRFRITKLEDRPLFFVLWSADTPLVERLLSGGPSLPLQIKKDRYTFQELVSHKHRKDALSAATNNAAESKSKVEPPGPPADTSQPTAFESATMPFGKDSIGYRVVGTSRGDMFRRIFMRLSNSKLILVYVSSLRKLGDDYMTALVERLSSMYPVFALEDMLLNHLPDNIGITVIEADQEGNIEALNYRQEHAFLRSGRIHKLSAQTSRNLHIHRWQLQQGDHLILLPSPIIDSWRDEIAEAAGKGCESFSTYLDTRRIGRTLELFR
mgnify:CR=1 FL=1